MKFTNNIINFQKIYLDSTNNLHINDLLNAMKSCYQIVKFTTFSYQKCGKNDSQMVLSRYRTGNCISFTYFIKNYLMKNFNAVSYIISASVPNVNKIEGTPHACHCALLVPLNIKEFAVIDGAFYFDSPMICRTNNIKKVYNSYMCDIYSNSKIKVDYKLNFCNKRLIDKEFNQVLLPDTLCVQCKYSNNPEQHWN